jgi:hypothetical protein
MTRLWAGGSPFWIGGSPCAGKSSVAALLAGRHGLSLFACDDGAPARMARMSGRGLAARDELAGLDTCVRLARSPRSQVELVLAFYAEQIPFLLGELPDDPPLLVEGADLLPSLLAGAGVPVDRSVWIVPTAEFQLRHYGERPWVGPYLASCPDPAAAFDSWMRRDILYARYVRLTAERLGGRVIVVDGEQTIEQTASVVEQHFGLSPTR